LGRKFTGKRKKKRLSRGPKIRRGRSQRRGEEERVFDQKVAPKARGSTLRIWCSSQKKRREGL